jgi:hypothetical protein
MIMIRRNHPIFLVHETPDEMGGDGRLGIIKLSLNTVRWGCGIQS